MGTGERKISPDSPKELEHLSIMALSYSQIYIERAIVFSFLSSSSLQGNIASQSIKLFRFGILVVVLQVY